MFKNLPFISIIALVLVSLCAISLHALTNKPNHLENMHSSDHSKYGLSGKFTAKVGKADELVSILLEAAELVSTAKGCHLYIVSRDAENGNDVWVYEVWDSKEDHANSLQLEGIRELISRAIPLIDGQPQRGTELKVAGGAGLR